MNPLPLTPSGRRTRHTGAGNATLVALIGVIALATLVRLYAAGHAENIARDGTVYLHMARQLANDPPGEVVRRFDYHPGYPAAIAAAATAFGADWPGGWIATGRAISVLSGLVALLGLFYVAGEVFDARCAVITVLLVALGRPFVTISTDVLSDSPAVALAMLAVAMGLRTRSLLEATSRWAIVTAGLAGVLAGLGYLTRPEALLSVAIAELALLRTRPGAAGAGKLQLTAALVMLAATIATAAPYAWTIGAMTHKKSIGDFLAAGSAQPLAAMSGAAGLAEAVRRVLDRSREAMSTGVFVCAAICGATWLGHYVLRLRLPRRVLLLPRRHAAAVMFSATVVMVPLLVGLEMQRGGHEHRYVSTRHALLHSLLLAPAAGIGVRIAAEWTLLLLDRLGVSVKRNVVLLLWVLIAAGAMLPFAWVTPHKGKLAYRAAGEAILQRFGPGHYVLGPDSRLAFFAGSPAEQFVSASPVRPTARLTGPAGVETLERLIGSQKIRRYEFLGLVTKRQSRHERQLEKLTSTAQLQLIGTYPLGRGRRLCIYRVAHRPGRRRTIGL